MAQGTLKGKAFDARFSWGANLGDRSGARGGQREGEGEGERILERG